MMNIQEISHVCPGWSGANHWQFFERVLQLPDVTNVLVLGVYMGRDLAYLGTIARNLGKQVSLDGVDLFSDGPGADWKPELRGKTWQEAHGVAPPNQILARMNLDKCGVEAQLFVRSANDYLRNTKQTYDFIYVDVSHDYETTRDVIELALPRLRAGGILAGDDFSNDGTWGVERAVRERFPVVTEHTGRIWMVTV